MLIRPLVQRFDLEFKPETQERYDNAGMQIIFPDRELTGILIALDIDDGIVGEAIDRNCNLVVSHHPFFFTPLRSLDAALPRPALLLRCAEHRLSLYAAHTNLDKRYSGVLARALGFPAGELLLPADREGRSNQSGFGTLVDIDGGMTLARLLALVRTKLGNEHLVYAGELLMPIRRIALLNGAGGSAVEKIIERAKPDCIITGDVGYHHARAALENGVAVIDAGHYATERPLLNFLREDILLCLTNGFNCTDVPLYIAERERDPFRIF